MEDFKRNSLREEHFRLDISGKERKKNLGMDDVLLLSSLDPKAFLLVAFLSDKYSMALNLVCYYFCSSKSPPPTPTTPHLSTPESQWKKENRAGCSPAY